MNEWWDKVPEHPGAATPKRSRKWGWITAASVVLVCYVTGLAVNNLAASQYANVVNHIFPVIGPSRPDTSTVDAAWAVIQQNYVYRSLNPTLENQGAVQGIVDTLQAKYNDRFTAYYSAQQYQSLNQSLGGERTGSIGIELEERCTGATMCASNATPTEIAVEAVLHKQPAENAGVRNGDALTAINGKPLSTFGTSLDDQINNVGTAIRGDPGTTVALTVERGTQSMTFTVTRGNLQVPSVYSVQFGTTLYLQITEFEDNTADDFRSQLQQGLKAGAKAIVLDLRDNPGGLVSAAQSVASEFLQNIPGKQQVVVVRRGRLDASGSPGSAQQVISDPIVTGGLATSSSIPVAVLVDGNSASAAEIVTAALQDYHRATVIGVKTYGKGSVQMDFGLPDGSDLHLTVEKWFTPNGVSIDGVGITPDQVVALPTTDDQYRQDAEAAAPSADPQLQAALTTVRNELAHPTAASAQA